jgi:hypothetical protein
MAQIKPREMSDVDKAKKLQGFVALYGPITLVKEKNWDGTQLEYVRFKYQGQQIKLPVGMVYDAPNLEALTGYFKIYAVGGTWH